MSSSDSTPSAKSEILARIRGALGGAPTPPVPSRRYQREGALSADAVREQLIDRLEDYRARAFVETRQTLPARIAELLGEARTCVIPVGIDRSWLPEGGFWQWRADGEGAVLSDAELDATDAVLTSSTVSCSETGTIFLTSAPDEGRRAISLVPDHHICVVPAGSIVELLPQALARVDPERPITMFSGPSATSDIELQRVEGVHGPRKLDVIILKD